MKMVDHALVQKVGGNALMSHFESNQFEELVKQAEEGDAEAQNILGATLVTGDFVQQDVLGGLYWYCQAIKKGYAHAKWNAGTMFIAGDKGIQKNEELGMRLIQEAADVNENSACLFLSQCYQNGYYGKEINKEFALFWEHKAWDYENKKEYDRPIDIEKEYDLKIKKPLIGKLK